MSARELAHDPSGWWNFCVRKQADGAICGLRYWYAWVPSTGRGKRVLSPESSQPHECRTQAQRYEG